MIFIQRIKLRVEIKMKEMVVVSEASSMLTSVPSSLFSFLIRHKEVFAQFSSMSTSGVARKHFHFSSGSIEITSKSPQG